jgi:ectoine hydroxylase-related dioxygenase (phytanoyl-CoA dioxygenase family)
MDKQKYDQLIEDGYCLVEAVLDAEMLRALREVTEGLLAAQPEEARARQRTTGSMIPITSDPFFADLIAWPRALESLAALGFPEPTFSDGWIISKPPHSPRLFWHYDWFAWEDPRSYEPAPMQLFLMYYLTDTRRENGCLRVIPGSHRRHNPLHDLIAAPHSKTLAQGEDLSAAEFAERPDEVDVPVRAGDLLIGDARLLHASHENQSDERRTLITLWYQPDLRSLPERMQAQIARKTQQPPDSWPPEARDRIAPLLSRYGGDAEPYGKSFYLRR